MLLICTVVYCAEYFRTVLDPQHIVVSLKKHHIADDSKEANDDGKEEDEGESKSSDHPSDDGLVGKLEKARFDELKWAPPERVALTRHKILDHYVKTPFQVRTRRSYTCPFF